MISTEDKIKNICPLGSSPEHQFVVQMNGNNATRYHIGVIDYKVFSLLPLNIEYQMNIYHSKVVERCMQF